METTMNLAHAISGQSVATIIFIYVALMAALYGANKIRKETLKKTAGIIVSSILVMITVALIFNPTNTVIFIVGGVYLALAIADTQVKKLKI